MNRQRLLLGILLFLLLLALVSAWRRMPVQRRVAQLTYRPGAGTALPAGKPGDSAGRQHLELPQETTQQFPVQRDIFAAARSPAAGKGRAALAQHPATSAAVAVAPPSPLELARRQLASFRVIGSYSAKKTQLLFLASGEEILTVRVGYPLIPGFRVSAITDEMLVLRSADGAQQLQLPLQP